MANYEFSNQYLYNKFPSDYSIVLLKEHTKEEVFMLKALHELFDSGLHRGKTMVEVGCGPTVHRLASASKYFTDIITSDYAPANREAVQKWLNADPQCLDWSPFLEIVAKLEGYSETSTGVKEIEARMRKNIKSVITCDVLKEHPLSSDVHEVDLLLCSYCLEGACPTVESYVSSVNKLGKYVRSGGAMIIIVVTNMSSAAIKDTKLKVLAIDLETVEKALKDAGFKRGRLCLIESEGTSPVGEFGGCALLSGTKL